MSDDYNLDPDFEGSVILLVCSDPNFFSSIGFYMEPELCEDEAAQWAVQAAKAIHKETGRGPSNELAVYQRLQRWADEGKMDPDIINQLTDLLEDAFEVNLKPTDVIAELRPILQGYHRHNAVQQMIQAHGRREDLLKETRLIDRAARIGLSTVSTGVSLGPQAQLSIAELKQLERFPIGLDDVDDALGGGVPRKSLTIWVGGPGDGKSMALSQTGAVGVLHGLFVAYVTLEIPVPYVFARTQAALTGYAIDDFLLGEPDALEYMEDLYPELGPMRVEYMEPGFTTPGDIDSFIDRIEDEEGRKLDMLIVDYLDRLAAPGARGKKRSDVSSYSTGEIVTTKLRDDITLPRNLWTHSAAQATRGKDGKKRQKGLDDIADSMHKARIADNVFTLNAEEQSGGDMMMTVRVAKHRTGRSNMSCGPCPAMYERGLIAPSRILSGDPDTRSYSAIM